ncbi:MAG TPA: penicillin-binding transpeptidase domain-containing protein [Pyrinomonadaceae bacterium]|nr:penicillin-binding transpeptidase domain-containing protein [Pyrinomonadaceae bacterium]
MTAREVRAQRRVIAREQASAVKALQRRLGRAPTARERSAELRRVERRHRAALAAARRRAEAARRAAIARRLALEKAMRDEVQAQIARDDITGEDLEVRRAAVNALGNHIGTAVVMDPMTGRIYSIVNQEWALRRGFKPCSTIKLVTGVAGLGEKVIDPTNTAAVSERYKIDLTDALAYSNNTYFQEVGGKVGFDKMMSYAKDLGLGEKTGINAPNEYSGRLPDDKTGWALNRMSSHGDDIQVTAVQLATLVSAMSNGGKLLVPQIARTKQDESKFKPKVRRSLDLQPGVWQSMVPGMVGAVNYGSGKKAYDPLQTVAGKTGTCIGDGGWLGLFTSYAPLANPRLAVVVIARGPDARRHFPAAVAGRIYRELNSRFGTPINLQIAAKPGADDPKAAELNEEEKDAAEAEAAEADLELEADATAGTDNQAANGDKAQPQTPLSKVAPAPSKVKPVLMQIERRPAERPKTEPSQPAAQVNSPTTAPKNEQFSSERPRRVNPN